MKESWQRIVAWHTTHTPTGLPLAAGVSRQDLEVFEQAIGQTLPADVRDSFLLHDGGVYDPDAFMYPDFIGYGELLPLAKILEQWQAYRTWQQQGTYAVEGDQGWEPEHQFEQIKYVFWAPTRIPLTDNSGNHLLVDLDPAPAGQWGQILNHDHEIGPRALLAPGWAAFLARIADELEAGKYGFSEEDGQLVPRAEFPLIGWTFVITGTLPTLSRQEAQAFIEQHGGRVTGSVSKRTDYLLAGEKAGSKLAKAQQWGVTIVSEAQLRQMVVDAQSG